MARASTRGSTQRCTSDRVRVLSLRACAYCSRVAGTLTHPHGVKKIVAVALTTLGENKCRSLVCLIVALTA